MIARMVMDLPEPDYPTIPTAPPRGTSRSRDFTTSVRPSAVGKLTVRSRTSRRFPSSEFDAVLRAVSGTDPHPRVDHGVQKVDHHVPDDHEDGGQRSEERRVGKEGQ